MALVSVVDSVHVGGWPYLTIFQDKTETSGDRFEGTEDICRFSHSTEEKFGGGRYSGLPLVGFVLIRRTRHALVGTGDVLGSLRTLRFPTM